MADEQPIDHLNQSIPNPREAFVQMWDGRLDEFTARVEELRVRAGEAGRPVDPALNERLQRLRECVQDVHDENVRWPEHSNRCERLWAEFEQHFRDAEQQMGSTVNRPEVDDSTCRSHGGQVGHQNTRQCPP
jgi:recombinational DNA repair ATPase RecF